MHNSLIKQTKQRSKSQDREELHLPDRLWHFVFKFRYNLCQVCALLTLKSQTRTFSNIFLKIAGIWCTPVPEDIPCPLLPPPTPPPPPPSTPPPSHQTPPLDSIQESLCVEGDTSFYTIGHIFMHYTTHRTSLTWNIRSKASLVGNQVKHCDVRV